MQAEIKKVDFCNYNDYQ